MSTAIQLIKKSMKALGILAQGESPSHEEAQDALLDLRQMLSSWNTQGLAVLGRQIQTLALTAGDTAYTVGPSGDLNVARPVKIDAAFIRDTDGNETPLDILDNKDFSLRKTSGTGQGIPVYLYSDLAMPQRGLQLSPAPISGLTLVLHTWAKFTDITTLTTEVSLPDGYDEAISTNLCFRLAPQYGRSMAPELVKLAEESLANVKRANIQSRTLGIDSALTTRGSFDIYGGK